MERIILLGDAGELRPLRAVPRVVGDNWLEMATVDPDSGLALSVTIPYYAHEISECMRRPDGSHWLAPHADQPGYRPLARTRHPLGVIGWWDFDPRAV